MTGSNEQAVDKNPLHMPESDRPRQNSEQYSAQRKQDAVKPSDYPEKAREAADLTRNDG